MNVDERPKNHELRRRGPARFQSVVRSVGRNRVTSRTSGVSVESATSQRRVMAEVGAAGPTSDPGRMRRLKRRTTRSRSRSRPRPRTPDDDDDDDDEGRWTTMFGSVIPSFVSLQGKREGFGFGRTVMNSQILDPRYRSPTSEAERYEYGTSTSAHDAAVSSKSDEPPLRPFPTT